MKIYLIRDRGTFSEDKVYTLSYNDDSVRIQDFIEKEKLEKDIINFTDYQEESNSDLIRHHYDDITEMIEFDDEDIKDYPIEMGSAIEIYPGPFEKIDSFCQDLCFMGLGSESCKDCPLAEAKKLSIFKKKEEK